MNKTKICNIVMMVVNLIGVIIFNIPLGLNLEKFTFAVIFPEGNLLPILLFAQSFIFTIINVIMVIINRKDKKVRFYYILLVIIFLQDIANYFITDMEDIILIIAIILLLISICIYNIKNRTGKFKFIIPVIAIVTTIILVILFGELRVGNDFMNIAIPIAFIVVLLIFMIKNEQEETHTNIIIIMIIIFVISIVGIKSGYLILQNNSAKKVEEIEGYVRANSSDHSDEFYMPVCREGRWGYTNKLGEEIIECKYDLASVMCEVKFENSDNGVILATVKDGEIYKLISQNDDTVWEIKLGKEVKEGIFNNSKDEIFSMNGFLFVIMVNINSVEEGSNKEVLTWNDGYMKSMSGYQYSYSPYNEVEPDNDGIYNVKTNKLEYTITTEIAKDPKKDEVLSLRNGKELYGESKEIKNIVKSINGQPANKEVEVYFEDINEYESEEDTQANSKLKVYSDGYLPYFNLEEKIQGYYDENFELITIKGNYQILDVKNNLILIREFDEKNEEKGIITLNMITGERHDYKQIETLENGYIVRKQNDKFVVLDNELKELSEEYDAISINYLGTGILVGINTDGDELKEFLLNEKGERISDKQYDRMLSLSLPNEVEQIQQWGLYGDYLLDSVYNEYYDIY